MLRKIHHLKWRDRFSELPHLGVIWSYCLDTLFSAVTVSFTTRVENKLDAFKRLKHFFIIIFLSISNKKNCTIALVITL